MNSNGDNRNNSNEDNDDDDDDDNVPNDNSNTDSSNVFVIHNGRCYHYYQPNAQSTWIEPFWSISIAVSSIRYAVLRRIGFDTKFHRIVHFDGFIFRFAENSPFCGEFGFDAKFPSRCSFFRSRRQISSRRRGEE